MSNTEKHLHIVSFNIPYPANYGGVIDVFHKLRWLHQLGIKIHLHCFAYGRQQSAELNKYCESVHYYRRDTGFFSQFSLLPYIVFSRKHPALLHRLTLDNYPILFEGLHSCYYLKSDHLSDRKKIYRESNIEHDYYRLLMKEENDIFRKLYLGIESKRLKNFEPNVQYASHTLAVTDADKEYFKRKYPSLNTDLVHSFHAFDEINCLHGRGDYVLFHGNLSVPENITTAKYILREIAPATKRKIIIAGLNPSKSLEKMAAAKSNVELIANPDATTMNALIQAAHINLLLSSQRTGLKLKLLNALYSGRHCLVNDVMLHGVPLHECCTVANTTEHIIESMENLFQLDFSNEEMGKRQTVLDRHFNNRLNAEKLVSVIYS